jgi:hypothetical protein
MIARVWHGWAPAATAEDYQRHYESEVAEHLRGVAGFRGARLLRQDHGAEVMFTSITFFTGWRPSEPSRARSTTRPSWRRLPVERSPGGMTASPTTRSRSCCPDGAPRTSSGAATVAAYRS